MDAETLIAKAADLPDAREFLAVFGHSLTVAARSYYVEDSLAPHPDPIDATAKLRAFNEGQHRVTAGLRQRLKGDENFAIKDLLLSVRHHMSHAGCEPDFEWCLKASLDLGE